MTFDLEEFDLPLEYKCQISEEQQFGITSEGLKKLVHLLDFHQVKATFFTTGYFCEKNPSLIKLLSENHEIGSHSFYHSAFNEEYFIRSKTILEKTSGKLVKAFRMPRFQEVDYAMLSQAGFMFDSSINPTYLPGRYNNFGISRRPYKIEGTNITEFPVSVSPIIRFPLSWFSFKNLNLTMFQLMCNSVLRNDKFVHLYFHPWEFAGIDQFAIPAFIRNPSGKRYTEKFNKLLTFLKKKGEFVTVSDFLENYKF